MANMRQGFQNVELIDKTIKSMKSGPFNMASWDVCICGHIARVKGRAAHPAFWESAPEWGAMMLGIDRQLASMLFATNLDAERDEAIRVLEILRDEGVVDWKRARDEVANEQLERMRIEFEDDRIPLIDRLHDEFDRVVEKARALALTL